MAKRFKFRRPTEEEPPPPSQGSDNGMLSRASIGLLIDEQLYNEVKGWTRAGASLPNGGGAFSTPFGSVNIHSDLEAPDVWANLVMYYRTGDTDYRNRAIAFGEYWKDHGLADLETYDEGNLLDHVLCLGMVQLSAETGDSSYTTAAQAILDYVKATIAAGTGTWTDSVKIGGYGTRMHARIIQLAVELGDSAYADTVFDWLEDGSGASMPNFCWNATYGCFVEISSVDDGQVNQWAALYHGHLMQALGVYYDSLAAGARKTAVGNKIVAMADFAKDSAMYNKVSRTDQHTYLSPHMTIDPVDVDLIPLHDGNPDLYFHNFDYVPGQGVADVGAGYLMMQINGLVKAWLITGTAAYLDAAELYWARGSKVKTDLNDRWGDSEIGYYLGTRMQSGNIFYVYDSEPWGAYLFPRAWLDAHSNHWTQLPGTTLETIASAAYADISNDAGWDARSPVAEFLNCWSTAVKVGSADAPKMLLPAVGGHDSWFPNFVLELDLIHGGAWETIVNYFSPYMSLATANSTNPKQFADGTPFTTHTYDANDYDPTGNRVIKVGGPCWGSSGGQGKCMFDRDTDTWSYTAEGSPPSSVNGMFGCFFPNLGANGKMVWHNGAGLYAWDPVTDTSSLLLSDTLEIGSRTSVRVGDDYLYVFGAYDSGGGVFVSEFIRYKVTATVAKQVITLTGDTIPLAFAPGFTYVEDIDRLVVWYGGADVYLITPSGAATSLAVTERTLVGAVGADVPATSASTGTYKNFMAFGSGRKIALLTQDVDRNVLIATLGAE